jgi:O-antigen/teichoic acid export membrane protein
MFKNRSNFSKETLYNYAYQSIFIVVNLILVPLLIKYLGSEKYGAWVLLLAFVSWMNIANFGLGNGLRNKIAENYKIKQEIIVNEFVSTSFYILFFVSAVLLLFVGILLLLIDDISWILNQQNILIEDEIRSSLLIILFGFCVNFILGVYKSIALGIQKSSWTTQSQALNTLLLLVFVIILLKFFSAKLTFIALAYVLASILSSIYVVQRVIRYDAVFIPKFKNFKQEKLKQILSLGLGFFLLQICMIIIFSTDNILIAKLFGLEYVTEYNIIDKVFTTGNTLFSILLIALWSAVTKAYVDNNFIWIRHIIGKMHFMLFLFAVGTIMVGAYFNELVKLWIGSEIIYSSQIITIFVVYTLLSAYGGIFVNIVNGIGKIKLQIYLMVFAAIVNIPLSILFGKYFGLGIAGIKLATLLSLLLLWIFIPLQVYRMFKNKEKVIKN